MIFIVVSSQTGFNHHMRYVLPAFPVLCIWCSRLFAVPSPRPAALRWLQRISVMSLAASLSSVLFVYPHTLSYFNEAVGGPKKGISIWAVATSIGDKIC